MNSPCSRLLLAIALTAGLLGGLAGCSSERQSSGSDQPFSDVEERTADEVALQSEADAARIDELIGSMTLEQKVAQLFIVTPEDLLGGGGPVTSGDELQAALAERPVGGVIFFEQNLVNPDQTTALLASTRESTIAACGVEPFLAIDEEGGTVVRVAANPAFGVQNLGDMADVGAGGDPTAAWNAATYMGGYLSDLGFNLDFAPVADVASNPESDTMRRRSFGSDPQLVAQMVTAQVEGFGETGVLCCAKHFPGIGDAVGDSHDESISLDKTLDELTAHELVPFAAAIDAGAPMVMVGHLELPAVTGDDTPASLSPAIITDVLRGQLGFEGVIVTDSFSMDAITAEYDSAQAAVAAIQAGADIVLMPQGFEDAYQGVLVAVADGTISEDRIDESLRRILALKLG